MRRALPALLASVLLALAPPAGALPLSRVLSVFDGTARSVRIERTAHGTAHVRADDDESLGYGMGYAYLDDNACDTFELLVTVRGERSRWFGSETAATLGTRTVPNRIGDAFVRSHMDDVQLAQAWSRTSPAAQARAAGFVAGANRWLADHDHHLPAACAGMDWVQPMTIAELRRIGELMAVETGAAAWADAIVGAQPPHADGTPARTEWTPIPPVDAGPVTVVDTRLAGGVAFAFGQETAAGGRGLLAANLVLPWHGLNRPWQVHLTIPGRLDAMGVTLGPLPWLVAGFNASFAWSATVSPARRFTLHELALVPGQSTTYRVDGKPEPMRERSVLYAERGADGQLVSTSRSLWSSRFGPVVVAPLAGVLWTPARAWALQDAAAGDAGWADAWDGLARAADVDAARAVLARQGLPWMATVATDAAGSVLYADASAVPPVDAAQLTGCAPSRDAAALWQAHGVVVLDGSRAACDWPRDAARAAAAVPMPLVQRRDWVQDAGSRAALVHPGSALPALSPLSGRPDAPVPLVARNALRGVAALLDTAATGGAPRRITPEDAGSILLADRGLAASLVLDDLLAACPDAPSPATRDACAVLAGWDRTNTASARGAALFREFWRRARLLPGLWRLPADPRNPVHVPAGLAISDTPAAADRRRLVFEALGQAAGALREAGFALDAPLGDLQRHASPAGVIPLGGGAVEEGVLNAVGTTGVVPLARAGYAVDAGSAWLALVGFDAHGPVARTLLPAGESSRPGAPTAFDQLPAWAAHEWITLPFHARDVEAQRVGDVTTLRFRTQLAPAAGR